MRLAGITIRWRDVQQRYFESLGKRNTGRRWIQSLIIKSWEVSWNMWEHRNGVLHNTVTPAQLREIALLNLQVEEEFQTGTRNLSTRDFHWFSKPRTVILQYDQHLKSQWLASVELARERYANRHELATASVRQQRRFMTNWLGGQEE